MAHRVDDKYAAYERIGLWRMIKSDMDRWGMAEAFTKLGFYAAAFYRISHFLNRRRFYFCARLVQFLSQVMTGAEISNKAVIGPAMAILHPTGIHIGPLVKIGSNATICECCSVVTNPYSCDGPPVIGDYLWLGAGCRIIGPVLLGDRVFGGPNSVVTRNVESDMMALGIPARVMSRSFLSPAERTQ